MIRSGGACERLHKGRPDRSEGAGPLDILEEEERSRTRVKLPIPKGVERRLRPLIRRGETGLRDWEWTWARAFVGGLVISFFAVTVLAVIPSWWIGFAEREFGWTRENRLLLTLRDVITSGWLGIWVGFFIVTFYKIQVIRKRLRGERQAERYSGGYR
jgi:hypothetical protein